MMITAKQTRSLMTPILVRALLMTTFLNLLIPTQSYAQNSITCKSNDASCNAAKRIADQALKNAEQLEQLLRDAQQERNYAVAHREQYRAQRDEARVQRDHLAGMLSVLEADQKRLTSELSKSQQGVFKLELQNDSLKNQRWYFGAAGIAIGILTAGATIYMLRMP